MSIRQYLVPLKKNGAVEEENNKPKQPIVVENDAKPEAKPDTTPNKPKRRKLGESDDGTDTETQLKLADGYKNWGEMALLLTDTAEVNDGASLCNFIRKLNAPHGNKWDLQVLKHFCDTVLRQDISENFYSKIFPWLAGKAVECTRLPKPRILLRNTTSSSTVSESHFIGLLVHAFLCIIPFRYRYSIAKTDVKGAADWKSYPEYHRLKDATKHLPDLNMLPLFGITLGRERVANQIEKLKCVFHYFSKMYMVLVEARQTPTNITVKRTWVPTQVDWIKNQSALCDLNIETIQKIEESQQALQVDFANESLGGGVIGKGCVQEEIRFIISPGLFLARMLCERLTPNDAVAVYGARQHSEYSGYAETFKWEGDHDDRTPLDAAGQTYMVAVTMGNMLNYTKPPMEPGFQYKEPYRLKELHKIFVSLSHTPPIPFAHTTIASGKWGCGVFGGDYQYKLLLQLCAASAANTAPSFTFHTFENEEEAAAIRSFRDSVLSTRCTVAMMYTALSSYHPDSGKTVFNHIATVIRS